MKASWFIENSRGRLTNQVIMKDEGCPLMRDSVRLLLSYCRYGAWYRKDTHFWTNVRSLVALRCTAATPCSWLSGGGGVTRERLRMVRRTVSRVEFLARLPTNPLSLSWWAPSRRVWSKRVPGVRARALGKLPGDRVETRCDAAVTETERVRGK